MGGDIEDKYTIRPSKDNNGKGRGWLGWLVIAILVVVGVDAYFQLKGTEVPVLHDISLFIWKVVWIILNVVEFIFNLFEHSWKCWFHEIYSRLHC